MKHFYIILIITILMSCNKSKNWDIEIYESTASGKNLEQTESKATETADIKINIQANKEYQKIIGFGGSFTESSAYLLNELGKDNRNKILDAYFGDSGAKYSLTRTHINSCDFSLDQYAYVEEGDTALNSFSVQEDKDDIIPMIKDAKAISTDGFKIVSSPWTAPPWMKDNNDWVGGKLLPEYYDVWANYFAKYLDAYKAEGIEIWGITVENEPHGNGNNWESMHFSPEEMTDFVRDHLGPTLEKKGWADVKILGYDQNREGLKEWVDVMYANEANAKYYDGTAIHWYESTYDYFPDALDYAVEKAPNKLLIQTEACVDAEVPHWKDDAWYWSKEATDWGWDWAPEDQKHLHPKYVPVYRYARDIIGCLNHGVQGWIDWNMVLDRKGGPNWFENWCVAPVIVDPEADEVYFTPLYYTMTHFSKFIRPNAKRIHLEGDNKELQMTAAKNVDGSIVVVLLNEEEVSAKVKFMVGEENFVTEVSPKSVQTIVLSKINPSHE